MNLMIDPDLRGADAAIERSKDGAHSRAAALRVQSTEDAGEHHGNRGSGCATVHSVELAHHPDPVEGPVL